MDKADLLNTGIDAVKDLKDVKSDVSSIKTLLEGVTSDVPPASPAEVAEVEGSPLSDDSNWVTEVQTNAVIPETYFEDHLSFQWMQTVLLVFVLVALFLNFGATLWLSFSDKWRS